MNRIAIICPNHDEPHVVYMFVDDGEGWREPVANRLSGAPLKGFDSTVEYLLGDKYVGNRQKRHPRVMGHRDFRVRYTFRCRECGGDNLPVREEKLTPVLDRLSAAGIDQVTIQGLASILV